MNKVNSFIRHARRFVIYVAEAMSETVSYHVRSIRARNFLIVLKILATLALIMLGLAIIIVLTSVMMLTITILAQSHLTFHEDFRKQYLFDIALGGIFLVIGGCFAWAIFSPPIVAIAEFCSRAWKATSSRGLAQNLLQ